MSDFYFHTSDKVLVVFSLIEQTFLIENFLVLFPFPDRNMSVFLWFFNMSTWLCPSKIHKSMALLLPPEISHSHTRPHLISSSSSKLPFKCSHQFIIPAALVPFRLVSAVILCIHLSLQISGCSLPWELDSLNDPRKVINFQFVQLFLIEKTRMMISKLFMCQSWKCKSPWFIFEC